MSPVGQLCIILEVASKNNPNPCTPIISHSQQVAFSGRGVNQNSSKVTTKYRASVRSHYQAAITDRSLFAAAHFIMNASHKSSLNDSSLNDSHSSACLLSGWCSWIKPLTDEQHRGEE